MRKTSFLALVTTAILISSTAAMAFSTDDKTLTNTDGTPRFSDPDDQKPASLTISGQSSSYGQQSGSGQPQGSYAPSAAPFSPANAYPGRQ